MPDPLVSFGGAAPQAASDAWVAPTATVIGDVRLGPESSVFYGAVVRADRAPIVLGDRSNLQDNVVVHADPGFPATVGAGVSVGHGAILHGCTVGDDCLIGMGAVVLNGAVIGEGSLVAAGAVVLGGRAVPPRSLVAGSPAVVKRELTDEELRANRDNATRYVALSREYLTAFGG